jgi:putative PEP-CTERM system histidine kinase
MLMGIVYWLAALAMLLVGLALLVRRGKSEPARNAALAAAASAGWAVLMVYQAPAGVWPTWNAMMADGFRLGAWLIALQSFASVEVPRWLRRMSLGLCGALIVYTSLGAISESLEGWRPLPLDAAAGLVTSLAALAATLHVWRHAIEDKGREVRASAAAVGAQFAIDALTYAQTQWQGNVDASLSLLRIVAVCVSLVPMAVGVWRLPVREPRLFISRQAMFFGTSLAFLSLFIGLTAVAAYYARQAGGAAGALWQTLVIATAAVTLLVLLVAEWPLRRLRVFISKHFYRNKYDYRVEWLRFVQTLSQGAELDVSRNAIRAVAQIFDSSQGLLFLRDPEGPRFYLKASWPERDPRVPDNAGFALADDLPRFLSERQWVIDLQEYRTNPPQYGVLNLPEWLVSQPAWRLISPLLVGNQLLGFLVLRAPPEPFVMTFEDLDLLKTVGRNVAVQLAQHRADEQLAQSRQFDAYNRFAAFVMHDLKNSVAQLQLLVANAARHRHNPVFVDDAIDTIRNTSERMTRLIEQLQRRDAQGTTRHVELAPVLSAAVGRSQARSPQVTLSGTVDGAVVQADPERLAAVIEHVVRNAQEATRTDGRVTMEMRTAEGEAQVTVVDDGVGMDETFMRERLFRPFDSTKGAKGMGIGAYQVREYVRSLGGDVDVWSEPARGTRFCIRLPLCPTKNPGS